MTKKNINSHIDFLASCYERNPGLIISLIEYWQKQLRQIKLTEGKIKAKWEQ